MEEYLERVVGLHLVLPFLGISISIVCRVVIDEVNVVYIFLKLGENRLFCYAVGWDRHFAVGMGIGLLMFYL